MTNEIWITLLALGGVSFAIRLGGFLLAQHLPQDGPWARGMEALPGCLVASLVAMMMIKGGPVEWGAGVVVFLVALKTRNLPVSMIAGMLCVAGLRGLVMLN